MLAILSILSALPLAAQPYFEDATTDIGHDLFVAGSIALQDYDNDEVATLVQGMRQAGSYAIHWDGKDGRGGTLSTGGYLYQLRVGIKVETHKLTLLR